MIDDYFRWILNLIERSSIVVSPDISFDRRDDQIGFIRGDSVFRDGSRLHFREYARQQEGKPVERYMYAYYYQRADGIMVFRMDDAEHYPHLKGFPHHRHSENGEVISSSPPDLEKVLLEIESLTSD